MYQIQLSDNIYSQVKRRADDAGFSSVDEYVVNVLTDDLFEDDETLDHAFTRERLEHIDRAAAQIKAGDFHIADEVRDHFQKRFAE